MTRNKAIKILQQLPKDAEVTRLTVVIDDEEFMYDSEVGGFIEAGEIDETDEDEPADATEGLWPGANESPPKK